MKFRCIGLVAAVALAAAAHAEEIILKVHHPLPPTSTSHQKVLTPWCDKIAAESKQRMKCQIYPAMQLGGTSTQLYDQAKDGVVDVIWTIPSYQAGRFPLIEVFELPFMTRDAEAGSKAVWDYVRAHAAAEFKDVKPLAFHVHGGGVLHMVKKPVTKLSDLRRAKLRAPTRQTTRLLAALGAVPVGMPIPQVPEALSKGVIDGALLPYEIVAAVKADELTRYHSEPDASEPTIYTSVFILAMNKSRYDGLPPDLKKVIDANSGLALSGQIGRIFQAAEVGGRKGLAPGSINVIPKDEIGRWRQTAQAVTDAWVKEMTAKGYDGQALLASARDLIAKHGH
jgi:TRAP-type C4-dicarboxylate transport system substrate-binding protein